MTSFDPMFLGSSHPGNLSGALFAQSSSVLDLPPISRLLDSSVSLGQGLLFLVGGWIVAIILSSWTKSGLEKTQIDNQIASWVFADKNQSFPVEIWAARIVFWLIFTFAIVGFLETLKLTAVSQPLNSFLQEITGYAPRILSAGLLIAVGWLVATIVRAILVRGMERFKLDDQLAGSLGSESISIPLNETLGNMLYWFIWLFFLPFILDALQLQGPLAPVQNLINELLSALPQILKAIIVGAVGWGVATIIKTIVTNFLKAAGIDRLGQSIGMVDSAPTLSLSELLGNTLYTIVLVVTAISALDALKIQAISAPAIALLQQILLAIPLLLKAGIILAIAFYLARFLVSPLVTNLLQGIGFDNVLSWLGVQSNATTGTTGTTNTLDNLDLPDETTPRKTPSEIVGIVAGVGVMLFGAVAAVDALQFSALTTLVTAFIQMSGQILVGIVVLGIGLYLSNLAFRLISMSGNRQSHFLAQAARVAILVLAIAMALQQMGVATNIVNLAFGLITGGIAVAIALAFGLGGREVAAEQLREWLAALKQP